MKAYSDKITAGYISGATPSSVEEARYSLTSQYVFLQKILEELNREHKEFAELVAELFGRQDENADNSPKVPESCGLVNKTEQILTEISIRISAIAWQRAQLERAIGG